MPPKLPPLSPFELVRALKRAGFVPRRRRGHHADWHLVHRDDLSRWAAVPGQVGQLSPETVRAIIGHARLGEGELLWLLRDEQGG